MKIFTALSLSKPESENELGRRFLAPFVERHFGAYVNLAYVNDLRTGTLPKNIHIHEFYLAPKGTQTKRGLLGAFRAGLFAKPDSFRDELARMKLERADSPASWFYRTLLLGSLSRSVG